MATTTAMYGFATGVATDDVVEASHHNRLVDTVDRTLGGVVANLINHGASEGWQIGADKAVGPGQGVVAACWCRTGGAQIVHGLTNAAVNRVYAVGDATSAPDGSVRFQAQLATPGPSGSAYLGLLELDAAGGVLAIDNNAPGVQRYCHAVRFGMLRGAGVAVGVAAGACVAVTVDHSGAGVFRLPGDLRVGTSTEDAGVSVFAYHRGDCFDLQVSNTGTATADVDYEWSREGVLA